MIVILVRLVILVQDVIMLVTVLINLSVEQVILINVRLATEAAMVPVIVDIQLLVQ